MTAAPASILATFAQPAVRLATGDATGAAMGGFEALLAMLTQSLQGADPSGNAESEGGAAVEPTTDALAADTPAADSLAADGDLAALLAQVGASPWLAQTLSQATAGPASTAETDTPPSAPLNASAPLTGAAPQAAPAILASMTRADLADETAGADTGQTAPVPPTGSDGPDMAALENLLPGQTFEAANQAPLAWRKPMSEAATAQLPGRPRPAAAPAAAAPAVETAVVAQVLAAEAETQPTANAQPAADAQAAAEAVAAPTVVAPPVEAKTPAAPRKAEARTAKVEASDAKPVAAPVETVEAAEAETAADKAEPADLAAQDETSAAPARTGETAVQALAARLETAAANATTLAAQVRGAPETVAKLAAGILDKLEGQSTRFDLQLDPHGLGKVDVSVEIASDGKLTAQLGFDSQLGLNELRGRVQELRTALEQAGFTLTDNALNFDFSGDRRQQQAADTRNSNSEQAGKAFARAMGSLDEDLAAAPTRYQARRGLDLLI